MSYHLLASASLLPYPPDRNPSRGGGMRKCMPTSIQVRTAPVQLAKTIIKIRRKKMN
jgi:hypothetical protein